MSWTRVPLPPPNDGAAGRPEDRGAAAARGNASGLAGGHRRRILEATSRRDPDAFFELGDLTPWRANGYVAR